MGVWGGGVGGYSKLYMMKERKEMQKKGGRGV